MLKPPNEMKERARMAFMKEFVEKFSKEFSPWVSSKNPFIKTFKKGFEVIRISLIIK